MVIPSWPPEMDNIFDDDNNEDPEYERHARIIVKSMAAFIENPENGINKKDISIRNFEDMNAFLMKLCDIGNLTEPKNNTDRYLIYSHAIFIADHGWDVFKNMMINRRKNKQK